MTPERLTAAADAGECARLMAGSEPWITLERGYEASLEVVTDPVKEVYILRDAQGIQAFVVIDMRGTFSGYIQTVCVRPDARGRGLGSALVTWAEERIFRDSPNVFMCVSSFNAGARRLYERLGYETVGTLRGFIVPDHDEILLRKTKGALTGWTRSSRS